MRHGRIREMTRETTTFRGELRCFACARYLGEFESHPDLHGRSDIHILRPEVGELPQHAEETPTGLRCSRCGGRAIVEFLDRTIEKIVA